MLLVHAAGILCDKCIPFRIIGIRFGPAHVAVRVDKAAIERDVIENS